MKIDKWDIDIYPSMNKIILSTTNGNDGVEGCTFCEPIDKFTYKTHVVLYKDQLLKLLELLNDNNSK